MARLMANLFAHDYSTANTADYEIANIYNAMAPVLEDVDGLVLAVDGTWGGQQGTRVNIHGDDVAISLALSLSLTFPHVVNVSSPTDKK